MAPIHILIALVQLVPVILNYLCENGAIQCTQMLIMEGSKFHFRHSLLPLFALKKSAAAAHQARHIPIIYFQRVSDKKVRKQCTGRLCGRNSVQTLKEFSNTLEIDESSVSRWR